MKKRTYAIVSATTLLALGGALALSHANKIESLLFRNRPNKALNTFTIDQDTEHTEIDEEDGIYSAVALSEENSLNTMFMYYSEYEGQLAVGAQMPGIFTNVDPMNRGFNSVHVQYTGMDQQFKYSVLLYGSYYSFLDDPSIEGVISGSYQDLVSLCTINTETTNGLIDVTFTDVQAPSLNDCKYVLVLVVSDSNIRLDEVSFGTPCLEDATEPDLGEDPAPGYYRDWKDSEKTLMNTKYGELIPFIGHGAYYLHEDGDDVILEGAFFDMDAAEAWVNGFQTDMGYIMSDFILPENEDNLYGFVDLQKKVGNEVYTLRIDFCMNAVVTYKLRMTHALPFANLYDEWPADFFRANLTSEYATFVINHEFGENLDLEFIAAAQERAKYRYAMVTIYTGFNTNLDAFNAAKAYLDDIVANDSTFYVNGSRLPVNNTLTRDCYYQITDGTYRISINVDESMRVYIYFQEPVLHDQFPATEINAFFNDSDYPVVEFLGNGKFCYEDRDSSDHSDFYLEVYKSNRQSLEAYIESLLQEGYIIRYQWDDQIEIVGDVFCPYEIRIYYRDIDNSGAFDINYNKVYNNQGNRFVDTLADALNDFSSDSLVLNHSYPSISGEHKYRVFNSYYSVETYRYGIYISDLDQNWIDELIQGATYDAYFNAYVFTDETSGSNTLAIEAEEVPGGIRIRPRVVNTSEVGMLLDSTAANAALLTNFNDTYGYLQSSDPDKYSEYLSLLTNVPDSNGEKVYLVSGLEVKIFGGDRATYAQSYHNALTAATKFEFSKVQRLYKNSQSDFIVERGCSQKRDYNNEYISFTYIEDGSKVFSDFVAHDDAGLATIESEFAALPHTGNEKIFYHESGSEYVVVDSSFDNKQFRVNLLANGFEQSRYNENVEFVKAAGTSRYVVYEDTSYYGSDITLTSNNNEEGFKIYRFYIEDNYYSTFNDALVNAYCYSSLEAEFIAAMPNYTAEVGFHFWSGNDNWIDFYGRPDLDNDAFVAALTAKGYVLKPSYSNTYIYNGGDYAVEAYISKNSGYYYISFRYYEYNWHEVPTSPAELLNTMYYYMSSYIPLPEDTGNIFCRPSDNSSESSFDFYLKSTADVAAYIELLQDAGYELQSSSGNSYTYLRYNQNGIEISCDIQLDVMGYHVSFYNNNSGSMSYSINSLDINTYLDTLGATNASAFANSFSFDGSVSPYSGSSSYVCAIQINFKNSGSSDFASALALEGYTQDPYDSSLYVKTTSTYRYQIHCYSSSAQLYVYEA